MSSRSAAWILGSVALLAVFGPARATTVTFDALNDVFIGDSDPSNGLGVLLTQGFAFTSSADHFHAGTGLPGDPASPGGALLEDIGNATITMTEAGGAPFDLLSAAVAPAPGVNPTGVIVTGFFALGGSVATTVAFVGGGFTTGTFDGFTGLSSVTFQATGGPFPTFNQFWLDDVNANVSAVPLPATAWLLASFIGWLPLWRRKDGAA